MTWVGLLLTLAITLRMTRLITADVIATSLRSWVTDRWGGESHAAVFIHCPWCVGWWVALATALATHWWDDQWWWQAFAVACAASWLTAIFTIWADES